MSGTQGRIRQRLADGDLESMGPLFSLAFVLVATLIMGAAAFLIARVFRLSHPAFVALAFPIGAVVGGGASVLLAALVVGVGTTLTTQQAIGYVAFLCFGSLASGALAVWFGKRVLTFNSNGLDTHAG